MNGGKWVFKKKSSIYLIKLFCSESSSLSQERGAPGAVFRTTASASSFISVKNTHFTQFLLKMIELRPAQLYKIEN